MPHKKSIDYPDIDNSFSDNALKLMKKHYFLKDMNGRHIEDKPQETFKRVCDFYYKNGMSYESCKKLYEYLMMQFVSLNSPVFYNIRENNNKAQLFACFTGIFEDSIDSITSELSKAIKIFKNGAGMGHNYGDLRPRNSSIGDGGKSIDEHGGSSGPLSFLGGFNYWEGKIRAGGNRRAAYLALLDCTHPDIEEFIECKNNPETRNEFIYANLSVFTTDDFMNSVIKNKEIELKWGKKVYRKVNAKDIFNSICNGAKKSGDPGIFFGDRAQEFCTIAEYKNKTFEVRTGNPCQPSWATVFTKSGIKSFNDINIGDKIWSKEGWTNIINKTYSGEKYVFKYITSDNCVFYGTENHRIIKNGIKTEVKDADCIDTFIGGTTGPFDISKYDCENHIGTKTKPSKIIFKKCISNEDVFNIEVDNNSHTYWTGGCNVSNCSEIINYAPYFCCNLGHINLYKVYLWCEENGKDFLKKVGELASFLSDFLDKNIDVNLYPDPCFKESAERTRPIGLGIMGYGEMLMAMKIRYGSAEAIKIAENIAEEITLSALESASQSDYSYTELENNKNRERLVYVLKKYKTHSSDNIKRWDTLIKHIEDEKNFRNCAVTTIAPTGTTGQIADSGTQGIEPAFALFYTRNVVGIDKPLEIVEPELKKYMDKNKIKSVNDINELPEYFVGAHDIDPINRIKTQSAFQKFVMFGISSTVNLPSTSQPEDIADIYIEAWKRGIKGITVFVDGCLKTFGVKQVLETTQDVDIDKELSLDDKAMKEQNRILKITLTKSKQKIEGLEKTLSVLKDGFKRPVSLKSETFKFHLVHNKGSHEFLVSVGEIDGKPIEVVITLGKSGTDEHALAESEGKHWSTALQSGIPLERLCRKFRGIKGDLGNRVKFREDQERSVLVESVPDCIAALLEYLYLKEKIKIEGAQECPSCKNITLVFEGGCRSCKNELCDYKESCG